MIQNKSVDLLENSTVKLTITVSGDDTKREYDNIVQDYRKNIQLKGFRKGKVPPDILKRKIGSVLISEAAKHIIEESIKEALETIEHKPLANIVPEVNTKDSLDPGQDFSFEVLYDAYPQVELGNYNNIEVEEPEVEITKEDLERELKSIQEQNALVVEKEEGPAEKDDIVDIDHVELNVVGEEKTDTKRTSFVFQIGTRYNLYEIDDDVVGMKRGEEKIVEKNYPNYHERKELAGREIKLKVTVNSIKEKKMPQIDDELAQDVSEKYETLEDLKTDIQKRLKDYSQSKVRERKINQILDKIVQGSRIPLPKSLIDLQLKQQWDSFVARYNSDEKRAIKALEEDGKSKDEVFDTWRPDAEKGQKIALMISKLIENEGLDVTPEELEEEIQKQAENSNTTEEKIREHLKERNLEERVKYELKQQKLFDMLLSKVTIKQGRKTKFLDLVQGNY